MRLDEIERFAMELPESDRAVLASNLLYSLPNPLEDEDDSDGTAEAIRREKEMDEDPSMAVSWEEIKRGLGR